ncbi:hypothetical protein LTS17_003810 [Exophiala oligosperma]
MITVKEPGAAIQLIQRTAVNEFPTILKICALLILLILPSIAIYNVTLHPLAKAPGPKLYAMSDLPHLHKLVTGRWPFELKKLHDKYGPVVRFGPNDVSFTSPQAWKDIYGYRTATKKIFMKDLRLYRGTLTSSPNILIANDADHSRMRRLLSHAFSEKALRSQEDLMEVYIGKLISALRNRAENGVGGGIVDMAKWYNFLTFDVLGDLAFGEPFGCLDSGGYHPWVELIFLGFKLASYMQAIKRHPWLMPIVKLVLPRDLIRKQSDHQKMSFEKAKQRAELGPKDRPDFMSHVLRANDEQAMTLNEMGENANILIVAGSETTATLLSGTTFWLLKNPGSYKKLKDEVRSAFQDEKEINLQEVSRLPYLLACLKEGLRMFPPVPSGLPRLVPEGGAFVDGTWLPEKKSVSVPHWATYHSASNFTLPDSYIPERWLDDPRFAHDNTDALQPFSYGPRNCLGMNLAYAEMRLALARVIYNFDFELQPESRSWDKADIFVFWQKGPLNVKITPRKL